MFTSGSLEHLYAYSFSFWCAIAVIYVLRSAVVESKCRTIFMAPLMGIPRTHLESQPFPKGWDFLSKLLKVFKALIATFRNRNTSPTSRMVVRIKWDDACQAPVALPGTDEEFYIWHLLLSYCKDCRMTSLTWFRHASSLMEPLQPTLDKKR